MTTDEDERRPECGCPDNHRHSPVGCLAVGCKCKATRNKPTKEKQPC